MIPPQGGHGADIYRELGATRVLIYSRIENDESDPDFVTGNQFARVGLVKDPTSYGSDSILTKTQASAVYAIRLTGSGVTAALLQTTLEFAKQLVSDQLRLVKSFLGMQTPEF